MKDLETEMTLKRIPVPIQSTYRFLDLKTNDARHRCTCIQAGGTQRYQ